MDELKAELKAELIAELRSGLEVLQSEWGDPLDDKSRLRKGLREEMRVQLHIASIRTESERSMLAQDAGWQADAVAEGSDRSDATSLGDEWSLERAAVKIQSSRRGREARAKVRRLRDRLQPPAASFPTEPEPTLVGALAGAVVRDKASDGSLASDAEQERAYCSHDGEGRNVMPLPTSLSSGVAHVSSLLDFESYQNVYKGSGGFVFVRNICFRLVHGNLSFDLVIGFAIIANCICIGFQIQWDLDQAEDEIKVTDSLEHVFLIIFVIELCIRALADGVTVLKRSWFLFDFVLVSIGVVSSWIVEPLLRKSSGANVDLSDGDFSIIHQVLIIRVLRLLRLIRSLRLLDAFQELWKLASGLMGSVRTVLSACLLIMIAVYIFAGLGIELITRNKTLQEDDDCMEIIDAHFRSLPLTMLTLVQFANADSIAGVYVPLITKAWYLSLYFGVVWLVVTISLMNLVTGVIVDRAISQGQMDREMERDAKRKTLRNLTPIIKSIFRTMDKDGNGTLRLSEIRAGLKKVEKIYDLPLELQHVMRADTLTDLFSLLDSDSSGEVDEVEFLEGVFHLALQSTPLETTQTLHLLRMQNYQLQLVTELTCMRDCHERGITLTKAHNKGCRTLEVELDLPGVEIDGGGSCERRSLQAQTFAMRLDTPLQHDFPRHSAVSQVKPEAS